MAGPFESHAAVFHTALSVADFALSLCYACGLKSAPEPLVY